MKIVVVGATGNVGTSLLEALQSSNSVDSIVGIARRAALARYERTEWRRADISPLPPRDWVVDRALRTLEYRSGT